MDFEWDEGKAARNLAKHGISFEAAPDIFDDPRHSVHVDDRFAYGEKRMIAVGMVDAVVLSMTFTMRRGLARVISVRQASRKERRGYDNRSLSVGSE